MWKTCFRAIKSNCDLWVYLKLMRDGNLFKKLIAEDGENVFLEKVQIFTNILAIFTAGLFFI